MKLKQQKRGGKESISVKKRGSLLKIFNEKEKKYWEEFYIKFSEERPSSFAELCFNNFHMKGKGVIDIGCGNGRDTKYFIAMKCKALGIDRACPEGKNFKRMKVEDLGKFCFDDYDIAYCRFLFHALREKEENSLIDWIKKNRKDLLAEFRSDEGVVPTKDHYRRLINGERFLSKLIKRGFKIVYYQKGVGWSPYGGEDPVLIRIYAKCQ